MGIGSNLAIELAEEQYYERKSDWIRRELNDLDADENTPGWDELEQEYDQVISDLNIYAVDEYEWHHSKNHSEFLIHFFSTVDNLKSILRSKIDPLVTETVYKMVHVHIVTAMETYLGDALKSAIISDKYYIESAAINLIDLSKKRFTLSEILKKNDGVNEIVLSHVSKYLYHDVPKVLNIYKAILGIRVDYNIENICIDTKIRHDIVHRNGKTSDGKYISIDNQSLQITISSIVNFIKHIDGLLAGLDEHKKHMTSHST